MDRQDFPVRKQKLPVSVGLFPKTTNADLLRFGTVSQAIHWQALLVLI